MVKLFFQWVIALLFMVSASAENLKTSWSETMTGAQANSRKGFKPIIVYFLVMNEGDPWKMWSDTISNEEIDAILSADFVGYKANLANKDNCPADLTSYYSKLKAGPFPIVLHIAPDGKTVIKSTTGFRDLATFKADLQGTLQGMKVSAGVEKTLADKIEKAKAAMEAKDHPAAIKLINDIENTRGWSEIKGGARALNAEIDQMIAENLQQMCALTRDGKYDEALEIGKSALKEFKASTSEPALKTAIASINKFASAAKSTNKAEKDKLYKAVAKDSVGTELGDLALQKMQE